MVTVGAGPTSQEELPRVHQAETVAEPRTAVRDAVQVHVDEEDRPRLIGRHRVRDEVIAI